MAVPQGTYVVERHQPFFFGSEGIGVLVVTVEEKFLPRAVSPTTKNISVGFPLFTGCVLHQRQVARTGSGLTK